MYCTAFNGLDARKYAWVDHEIFLQMLAHYDIHGLIAVQNKYMEALDTWLKGNKLFLNVAKTQSMTISTKQKKTALEGLNKQLNLKVRDAKTLEVVQSTKYQFIVL